MNTERFTTPADHLPQSVRETLAKSLLTRAETSGDLREGLALVLGPVSPDVVERFDSLPPGDRLAEALAEASANRVEKSKRTI
jgi:hypothetical protein